MSTYTDFADLDQALSASNPPIETNSSINLIDEYARSERGDFRVIAALLTIERENAEPDRQAAATPTPVPPPAITTADYADDGQFPYLDAAPVIPVPTPQNNAIAASRLGETFINGMRKASRRAVKPAAPRRTGVKPTRAARARAPHSRGSHTGARKGDDGDGGDAPPETATARLYEEPDGRVLIEQDVPGTKYVYVVEFDTLAEAVRSLLGFEQWARANGTWVGPSFCDERHPLNPLIRETLATMEVEGNA